MRIAVFGVGGVGGYFGGRLVAGGAGEVAFIARGAHLAALREKGLTVKSANGDFSVAPIVATDDPAEVGPVEAVLFCVKTYHVAEAAPLLAPLVGTSTAILPLQNGVETPEMLKALYGEGHVMGGLAYISAAIDAPGTISNPSTLARLIFGELDGRRSRRAEALLTCLQAAGIDAELSAAVRAAMWQKFLFICGLAGLTAASRRPIGAIRATVEARVLLREAMAEVTAVAALEEVALPADAVEQAMRTVEAFAPDVKASLLLDLEQGRPLELEALNGAVVRLAARHALPVPVNRALYAIIRAAAAPMPA
ncbi:MAG TPA: 2-dehydropantoate 2-reductase [Chloroflexi bacterium]|nr:2-dehydropantoate 2-reductase [Chloroflexota bacterium]